MTDPNVTVGDVLDQFGAADASAPYLLCDRHPQQSVAFTVIEADLSIRVLTFGELRDLSERAAGGLAELGVGAGDRVATLVNGFAARVVAMIAIWRLGAVQVPLFTAFAPPAIAAGINENETKIVIADAGQVSQTAGSSSFASALVIFWAFAHAAFVATGVIRSGPREQGARRTEAAPAPSGV